MAVGLGTTQTAIKDQSSGSLVGVTGDRLKVDAVVQISPAPQLDVIYVPEYLKNGSNISMTVNGSGTPVQYSWAPATNETWYLVGLTLFLIETGTMDATDFGSGSALTNGLLIEIRSKGTTYTFCNIQNNMDLGVLFGGSGQGSSGGLFAGTSGFYDTNDIFQGQSLFEVPIKLQNSTGDFIRITVRDNLAGRDQLRASIAKWRLI